MADRQRVLSAAAEQLTPEKAAEFVQAYLSDVDALIRQAQDALIDPTICPPGSLAHQNYIRILESLQEKRIAKLQQIGVVRNDLGTLNVREEVWEASVEGTTGVIHNRKLTAEESADRPSETNQS